jgi:hypothetical protein
MPKFFINFRNGDKIIKDDQGDDYPNLEAAREAAFAVCPGVGRGERSL